MDLGSSHILVEKITSSCRRVGWGVGLVLKFSRDIDDDFEQQKTLNRAGSNVEIAALVQEVAVGKIVVKRLTDMLEFALDDFSSMKNELAGLSQLLRDRSGARSLSSPRSSSSKLTAVSRQQSTSYSSNSTDSTTTNEYVAASRTSHCPSSPLSSNSTTTSTKINPPSASALGQSKVAQASVVYDVVRCFDGADKWSLADLVVEAGKQNVDLQSFDIGECGGKQEKNRVKTMLTLVLAYATEDEKSKLKPVSNAVTQSVSVAIETYWIVARSLDVKTMQDLEDRERAVVLGGGQLRPIATKAVLENDRGKNEHDGRRTKKARKGAVTVSSVLRRFQFVQVAEEQMRTQNLIEKVEGGDDDGGGKRKRGESAKGEGSKDDEEERGEV